MAVQLGTRLVKGGAALFIAAGLLAFPLAGTASAYTYPTHTYTSAQIWQCADNAWQGGLRECAWVQYSVSYHLATTTYTNGLTYYYVTPAWSTAYVWGGASLGYNQWYAPIGQMRSTVNYYTPDGVWRQGLTMSGGYCGAGGVAYSSADVYIPLCTTGSIGITLRTTTYPFYGCYSIYFDQTLMYDNSFGYNVCFWVYK